MGEAEAVEEGNEFGGAANNATGCIMSPANNNKTYLKLAMD